MSATALYDALGVKPDATPDEIKTAFRALSKKYHPDMRPDGSPERFRAISDAYDVLMDPAKRAFYDEHGVAPNAPPEENKNAELYEFAYRAFQCAMAAVITEGRDPETADMIAVAVHKINEDLATLAKTTAKVTAEVAALEKIKARIVRKSGEDNVLAKMFHQNIAVLEAQLVHNAHQVELCGLAVAFLKDYEYRHENVGHPLYSEQPRYRPRQGFFSGGIGI